MSGTRTGGVKAAMTNKAIHGDDFYKVIGARGGSIGRTGGFAAGEEGRERAKVYGAIGGSISRRGPSGQKKERVRKDGKTQAEFLTAKYQRHLENIRADQERIRAVAEQKLKRLEELRNREAEIERKLKGED
jgi:flagellar motility protein MotE (MotC chaperone)